VLKAIKSVDQRFRTCQGVDERRALVDRAERIESFLLRIPGHLIELDNDCNCRKLSQVSGP
jgi:hypothetical protein